MTCCATSAWRAVQVAKACCFFRFGLPPRARELAPHLLEPADQAHDRPQRVRIPAVHLAVTVEVGAVVRPPREIRVHDERRAVRRACERDARLVHHERELADRAAARHAQDPEAPRDRRDREREPAGRVHDLRAQPGSARVRRRCEVERVRPDAIRVDEHRNLLAHRHRAHARRVDREHAQVREDAGRRAPVRRPATDGQDIRSGRARLAVRLEPVPRERREGRGRGACVHDDRLHVGVGAHLQHEALAALCADAHDDAVVAPVRVGGERHAQEAAAGAVGRIVVRRRPDHDRKLADRARSGGRGRHDERDERQERPHLAAGHSASPDFPSMPTPVFERVADGT